MSLPRLGQRFRGPQPTEKDVRPRTSIIKTKSKPSSRLQNKRQSVTLPALVPTVDSDTDYESDSSLSDETPTARGGRKPTRRLTRRVPLENNLAARSSRQLVINQQKLMLKYATQEQELKTLRDQADLIKLELDRIRVMKTPEPEVPPVRKRQTWWATDACSPEPITPPLSPESVHLGSTCLFDTPPPPPSVKDDVSTCSTPEPLPFPSPATPSDDSDSDSDVSYSGNSSFLYSDTDEDERLMLT